MSHAGNGYKLTNGVLPTLARDDDPRETAEWLESLDYVCQAEGPQRAAVPAGAAQGAGLSTAACPSPPAPPRPMSTPSRPISSPSIPATAKWSGRSRASSAGMPWRWWCGRTRRARASAGIFRPMPRPPRSMKSPSTTSFTASRAPHAPDQVFFQGHAAPGIYSRAFLLGRLSEQQLKNFRRELAPGGGLSSLSAPLAHARLLGVPHGLDGPGPHHGHLPGAVQPLPGRSGHSGPTPRPSRVWAFLGDGECDEPEALGAITLAGREQLDNLIFVVNCNLQRLDGPVRGNGKIVQELEGAFRGAGWNVIKVLWGSNWDPLLERDTDGLLVRRMGEVVDGEYQKYTVMPGGYIREHFFGVDPPAAGDGGRPERRSASASCSAAATIRPRSTRPTRRRSSIEARPRSSWPRPSRATGWARPAKAATSPTSRRSSTRRSWSSSAAASRFPLPTSRRPTPTSTSRRPTARRCATWKGIASGWAVSCPAAVRRRSS